MSIIPKLKFNHCNGKTQIYLVPKNVIKVGQTLKQCSLLFSIFLFSPLLIVVTNQTTDQVFSKQLLERLRNKVRRKRSKAQKSKSQLLHHDNNTIAFNTSFYTKKLFYYYYQNYYHSKNILLILRPLYLPDLASYDFILFPKLKTTLKDQRFKDVNKSIHSAIEELKAISQRKFKSVFKKEKNHSEHYVEAKEHYFKGGSFKWSLK